MSSIVLELQQEVLKSDCDILNALRKAHVIAVKLKLSEFDSWVMHELNGYSDCNQDDIPDYRKVHGSLKAWNPMRGWIPVAFQGSEMETLLCDRKLDISLSQILALYDKPEGNFSMSFVADVARTIDKMCTAPFPTDYALSISNFHLKSIVDQVTTRVLEWTLKLEGEGILGENMQFSQEERTMAQNVPQQINYYGTVINGDVKQSQVVSGSHNTISFNYEQAGELLKKVKEAIKSEQLSREDRESAEELIEDAEAKIASKKKSGIIRAALTGLKDFLIGAGANVAGTLIVQYLQHLI